MGWASANGIFDPIAEALIEHGASVELKRKVLVKLIEVLRDGDWDTEDESLDRFRHDPAIVSAFYTALDGNELGSYPYRGRVSFDDENEDWVVECLRCGVLGHRDARLHDVEWSVKAHNELIALWAAHDQERHEGDGEVPEWDPIGGDSPVPEGIVDFDEEADRWVVSCDECGTLGTGLPTAAEHNRLVRLLVEHDKDKHGGDGVIPAHMLIDGDSDVG